MKRDDTVAGGLFLALGVLLIASGSAFPPGIGGLPGAGFFPRAIGGLMAALAVVLALKPIRAGRSEAFTISNRRQVTGTLGLLFGYLCLWGTGFFAVRTAVYLALTLRFLGQGWVPALTYSTALTAFVWLAFDMGLNVSLQ